MLDENVRIQNLFSGVIAETRSLCNSSNKTTCFFPVVRKMHSHYPTFSNTYTLTDSLFVPGDLQAAEVSLAILPFCSLAPCQRTTRASLPSACTCARRSTQCAGPPTCWRAPCPPTCPASASLPASPSPTPGSAPTHSPTRKSETSLRSSVRPSVLWLHQTSSYCPNPNFRNQYQRMPIDATMELIYCLQLLTSYFVTCRPPLNLLC